MTAQNGVNTSLTDPAGFSLGRLHMGGGQSVNGGGTHEGGHRPYGGT